MLRLTADRCAWNRGGGNGSQLAALKNKCPDIMGRMILQDQAYVLEGAMAVEGMEKMAHDFFTEQPVKGTQPIP